ncbi:MAG: hypothetical protein WC586_06290 [Methanoregula sp.]
MQLKTLLICGLIIAGFLLVAGCTQTTPQATTPAKTSDKAEVTHTLNMNTPAPSSSTYQIRVTYAGKWTGFYGTMNGPRTTVEGTGTQTYTVVKPDDALSASFQKADGGSGTITAEILKDGQVQKSGSATDPYGIAMVTIPV